MFTTVLVNLCFLEPQLQLIHLIYIGCILSMTSDTIYTTKFMVTLKGSNSYRYSQPTFNRIIQTEGGNMVHINLILQVFLERPLLFPCLGYT